MIIDLGTIKAPQFPELYCMDCGAPLEIVSICLQFQDTILTPAFCPKCGKPHSIHPIEEGVLLLGMDYDQIKLITSILTKVAEGDVLRATRTNKSSYN